MNISELFQDKSVRIKRKIIGEKEKFSIRTIKSLTINGTNPSGPIKEQLNDLQSTVESIVNYVNYYKLERLHIYQEVVQAQVDEFCNNLLEFGKILDARKNDEASKKTIIDICEKNSIIIAELKHFTNYLNKRYLQDND